MANYNDVLGVLRAYRNELEQRTQEEAASQFLGNAPIASSFAARGGTAAF